MATNNRIEYSFLYGEKYDHYYSPFEKLHEIQELPGLYTWYLRLTDDTEVNDYFRFFYQLSLNATIEGNIRLQYKGKLNKEFKISSEISNIDLLKQAVMATNYPLYIGISSNLKNRLIKHKDQFLSSIKSKSGFVKLVESDTDNDNESAFFGSRLAELWTSTSLSTDSLYVKYIIHNDCMKCPNDNCSPSCKKQVWNELLECEYICNSLYNPVFGRR